MNKEELMSALSSWGASAARVADVSLLKGIETEPEDLLDPFPRAISIGVRLASGIIDAIEDKPTPLYQQHYYKVNALLDDLAVRISQFIEDRGGRSLPIPASHVLNKEKWTSYISHKAVAIAAGLGWQGKSLLLVHPVFGPRIRLATVLTDLDIEPDPPLKNQCGNCSECAKACPVGAIKNVNTDRHYKERDEALYFKRCVEHVTTNPERLPFIEHPLCGVCIRACPRGKKNTSMDHSPKQRA
ncbi:MAG: 4Fe-4S double cluster binding domain-containing protein [Desulfomonilaceae bacterium]